MCSNSFSLPQDAPFKFCGYDDFNMFAPKVGVYFPYTMILIVNLGIRELIRSTFSSMNYLHNQEYPIFYRFTIIVLHQHMAFVTLAPGYLPQQLEFDRSPSFPPHLSEWPTSLFQLAELSLLRSPFPQGALTDKRLRRHTFSTPLYRRSLL